jgi:hypothetical protein
MIVTVAPAGTWTIPPTAVPFPTFDALHAVAVAVVVVFGGIATRVAAVAVAAAPLYACVTLHATLQ